MTKFAGWAGLFLVSYLAGCFVADPWRIPGGYILMFIKIYITAMFALIVLANLPRLIKWSKQGWDEVIRRNAEPEATNFSGGMQLSFVSAGATGATEKNTLRLLPDVKTKRESDFRGDAAEKPAALKAVVLVEVPAKNWRRQPARGQKKATEVKPLAIVKSVVAENAARLEQERAAKLELEKAAQLEQERAAKLELARTAQLEQERAAKLELARTAQLEQERAAQLEQARTAQLEQERAAKLEQERAAKLEQERAAKLELARTAQLAQERAAKLELEKAAQLELARTAQLEQERAAKLEQERAAKLEQERAAKLELARTAQLEQERAAQLELARTAQLEQERAAKLEQAKHMELRLRRSTSCHLRCNKPGGLLQGPILAVYCKWICKSAAKS